MNVRAPDGLMPSLSRPGWVIACVGAAMALNSVDLELLGGARVLLGGFVTIPCVLLLRVPWGVLVAALAFAPTIFVLGHPFALILGIIEALWLTGVARTWRRNVILSDAAFWLVAGFPLGWALYGVVGRLPTDLVVLTVIKQAVTQLGAATVAHFIMQLRSGRGTGSNAPGLRVLVFNYMFVLAAVPLVLVGLGFSVMSRQVVEDEQHRRMLHARDNARRQVELFLTLHQAPLQSAARFIEQHPAQAGALIEEIRRAHPALITMLVADAEGRIVETAPREMAAQLRGSSVADRDYFRVARERAEPYVSGVFRGRGFGHDILVAISVPFHDAEGRFAGIVQGSLEIERFGKMALETGVQDVRMILADAGGGVIYADPATGLRALEDLRRTALRPLLEAIESQSVTHDLAVWGQPTQRVRSYVARCATFGLLVIAQQPLLAPMNELRRTYAVIGVVFGGVLCGAAVVARAARKRLAGPLEHFARDAEAQAQRGTAAVIVSPGGPLPREVELVFTAFNRLAVRLQATYAELRRNNAELDHRVAERTAEAENARQLAEAASRSKSEFLTMTSHEIRTPLNAIINLADPGEAGPVDPAIAERFGVIRRAGERLLRVVNDLLDLSRVEAGKLELSIAPVEVASVQREILGLFSGLAQAQGLALIWETGADVPAWIKTDVARLQQVLVNLVGNGLKFTRAGSVRVVLQRIGGTASSARLRFAVTDTGPGIPVEEQSRLFEPFAQIRGAAGSAVPGSGLGLMISRRLVGLLGGALQLHSAAGCGAEFFFEIDVALAAPPPSPASGALQIEPAPPMHRRWRVLVADDNTTNQEVLRLMLESRCERLEIVDSGTAALHALRREHFDVALVDLDMPDLDGLAVARAWTSESPNGQARCQLIAVSAHLRQERWDLCAAAGFAAYVEKPIDRGELLRQLGATCGPWRPQAGAAAGA